MYNVHYLFFDAAFEVLIRAGKKRKRFCCARKKPKNFRYTDPYDTVLYTVRKRHLVLASCQKIALPGMEKPTTEIVFITHVGKVFWSLERDLLQSHMPEKVSL
jgi:hypothetical protein